MGTAKKYILTNAGMLIALDASIPASWGILTDTAGYFATDDLESAMAEVGQELLVHNLNGWEDASTITLSWNNATREITVTPAGTSYYWSDGVRYSISSPDTLATTTDTSGTWWWYYDGATLTVIHNPSHTEIDLIIESNALVAAVYWNTNPGVDDTVLLANELHGCIMSGATHHWIHDALGAQYKEGGGLSGYTLDVASDAAISFDLTDIEYYDDDIEHVISDGVAANQYEQVLTGDAEIPVLYRDDVDGSWIQSVASTLPYLVGGTPRIAWNMDDGDGTWSQQEVSNNDFCLYFLVVTNDWEYPVKMVQGSAEYNTLNQALDGANTEVINWGELPGPEFLLLYIFVMQDNSGGTTNARIREIIDLREQSFSGGGSAIAVTDHGGLTGLGDDDHTQYLLIDGTRSMTGDLSWVDGVIATFGIRTSQTFDLFIDAANTVANSGWNVYVDGGISVNRVFSLSAASGAFWVNFQIVDHYLQIIGPENQDGLIYLYADEGDDQADWWRLKADAAGYFGIEAYSAGWVDRLVVDGSGAVFVNEIANTGMTIGITINQGPNDDEILAFKSSDVVHGVTDWMETDTYAAFDKVHNTAGGLKITTAVETGTNTALRIRAIVTDGDTTKNSTAGGPIELDARKKSGTGTGAMGANENLVVISENSATRWLVDEDGDTWQGGNVIIDSTKYIILDGDTGNHTRIFETSDNMMTLQVGGTDLVNITPLLFMVGDSSNAKMTKGITINQGNYDNEILALKSSDISHGATNLSETDTFGIFLKTHATAGGLQVRGYSEDVTAIELKCGPTNDDTTKSTAGVGPCQIDVKKLSGVGWGAVGANANLFTVRANTSTKFIVDEDGDYHYDGADGGAFDDYHDAQLVRAFSLATSKDVVRTRWDEAIKYNEASLVETGILGDTVDNGGLVNGAQLQRLHNGAIWQLYQTIQTQALRIESLEDKLKLLEM